MKCSVIDRSTICFDHLATPLQHPVDQSLYNATLIQVGPGPLQNALEFLQRGFVLHLLVGFLLDVIPEVLDGVTVGGPCKIENLWDNIKRKANKKATLSISATKGGNKKKKVYCALAFCL